MLLLLPKRVTKSTQNIARQTEQTKIYISPNKMSKYIKLID